MFNADWDQRDWDCGAYEGLLWSNSNSRYHMAQFIDTATDRLDVQHPKYVDAVILDRLAAAAIAASKCMCSAAASTASASGTSSTPSRRCGRCAGSASKVHKQKNLRVHAKLMIVDDEHALVGSMNIDRSAFDLRRELGITIDDPAIVGAAEGGLRQRLGAVAPLRRRRTRSIRRQHHEDDFPHDHDLMHE